ncbi:MAG: cell division protein SepF [Collinsella intestinalis]
MLGQTRRGEAESVAVYTRSGQLVGRPIAMRRPTALPPSLPIVPVPTTRPRATPRLRISAGPVLRSHHGPGEQHRGTCERRFGGYAQLPAYVLRPESYDDVEIVVRRVRTRQPVVLVFAGRTEVAKRVLDFSYGFACGSGASVRELGDRVFIVLPVGCEVKETDLAKLRKDGYLKQ